MSHERITRKEVGESNSLWEISAQARVPVNNGIANGSDDKVDVGHGYRELEGVHVEPQHSASMSAEESRKAELIIQILTKRL